MAPRSRHRRWFLKAELTSFAELAERASELLEGASELLEGASELLERGGPRRVLGLTGPPAAGKSSLAGRLEQHLAGTGGPDHPSTGPVAVLGMDGFHLADAELRRQGLIDVKGAPETFDRAGFAALLARVRHSSEVVYAPVFDRAIEDSIAAAQQISDRVRLVIVEGNYLLLWPEIAELCDEVWYLDPPQQDRVAALVDRHVSFGRSTQQARERALGSDEANARLIAGTRERADLVVGWL
jgi:pantothenate kinase